MAKILFKSIGVECRGVRERDSIDSSRKLSEIVSILCAGASGGERPERPGIVRGYLKTIPGR